LTSGEPVSFSRRTLLHGVWSIDICILNADQEERTNVLIGALYVLIGFMMHAAATTQMKIVFVYIVVSQTI